jgi:hypothetical protein
MSRGIYEIKLKDNLFPALSAAEAVEMRNNCIGSCHLQDEEVEVKLIVSADHTMQMFLLAKTMYDMEKFTAPEIDAVIRALALQMGYINNHKEVADCVIKWVERAAEDMTLHELEEWIIG